MHSRFDNMLEDYRKGTLSEEDIAKMDAWIDALGTNEEVTWTEDEQRLLFNRIKSEIATKQMSGNPNRSLFWLKVAASVALIIATTYLIVQFIKPVDVDKTILQDGSIVWLKSGSKLSYIDGTSDRSATLAGEGLFEIAKESRPFIIECNNTTVRVKGTSFKLRSHEDNFELYVLTGHVLVQTGSDSIEVTADQRLQITSQGSVVTPVVKAQSYAMVAGTQYDMKFSDTDMATVMEHIEDKFDVTISTDDNTLGRCRVTADFTDRSLRETMQLITEILDVEFVIDKNSVRISGNGCHNTDD